MSAATNAVMAADRPHNVVLFVPDGLRAAIITPETAPTFAQIRDQGVNFANSHSLFPTFTMPNSSGLATGHYLGDTGTYSNTIYTGYPVGPAANSPTPFIENDAVLGDVDAHFAGDYLDEETILHAAHKAGFNTAAIGKVGPTLVFAHTERDGTQSIVVDDATGSPTGIPLAPWLADAIKGAGLPAVTPTRGDNGKIGNAKEPGTKVANIAQQAYFTDVLTKAVLPKFHRDDKPFVIVFWSRDPDGSQHNQGDSLLSVEPGINGPTSMAAIRNADDNLAAIRAALSTLGLAQTTDIIVSADHGFSTISKQSATSPAAKDSYVDVPASLLPPGFLAIDLAKALGLPLWDPDQASAKMEAGKHPRASNGLIGDDPAKPTVVVAANGGSDLVYVPNGDRATAQKVVDALLAQDYVSGLFVDDSFGPIPGTLPLSAINLKGAALTPLPAIAVNFKSVASACGRPTNCSVEIADSVLQQGQGMHGSFGRGDTFNFMAAFGPDFRQGFVDTAPTSNADIGKTIAKVMGLTPESRGKLVGRTLDEALPGGTLPAFVAKTMVSEPSSAGLRTVLNYQLVGDTKYFDAAGFDGRTVGLKAEAASN